MLWQSQATYWVSILHFSSISIFSGVFPRLIGVFLINSQLIDYILGLGPREWPGACVWKQNMPSLRDSSSRISGTFRIQWVIFTKWTFVVIGVMLGGTMFSPIWTPKWKIKVLYKIQCQLSNHRLLKPYSLSV